MFKLAGPTAGQRLTGAWSEDYGHDTDRAEEAISWLVKHLASDTPGVTSQELFDDAMARALAHWEDGSNWKAVEALAASLLEKMRLEGDEAYAIIAEVLGPHLPFDERS